LIYRPLANQSPSIFQRNLVDSLWGLADIFRALGRTVDAAASDQEAVSICLRFARPYPRTHSKDLVHSLWKRADFLRDEGRAEEASNTGREVIDIYHKPRRRVPELCRKELVVSQWRLSELPRAAGRLEDASVAETQVVETLTNFWGSLSYETHRRRVASLRVLAKAPESSESLLERALSDTPEPEFAFQSGASLRDSTPEETQRPPGVVNTDDLISRLLEVGHSGKVSKYVCLSNSEITLLCSAARQVFLSQPMLIELSPLKIVGDVRAQYSDLIRLFEMSGFPPISNYLFLGAYVDDGKQGLETILLLLCYKIKYPESFFMLRGDHECADITRGKYPFLRANA
jgi:hypothetical protein